MEKVLMLDGLTRVLSLASNVDGFTACFNDHGNIITAEWHGNMWMEIKS